MIHEQNGVLGRVNQVFARRVDTVACGTWPTALPAGVTGEHTGNPVRAAVLERAGAAYIPPGDYPMSVAGDRRQPGRARPVGRGARGGGRAARRRCAPVCAWRIRRATRMPTRVAAAYDAAGVRAEVQPLLHRHSAPPVRGAAGDLRASGPRRLPISR